MKRTALIYCFLIVISWCQSVAQSWAQRYTLAPLPYPYGALEPHLDATTMEIHHTRHHQTYINNLNQALEGSKAADLPIEKLLLTAGRRSDAIRNNAGGHYNHTLFWQILSPTPSKTPTGALATAIKEQYGSLDSVKALLSQAAKSRFGSGWAWLVVTPGRQLKVLATANQDNPIMDVATERGIPILGIDVWEHAYYLRYQNKRADYIAALWNVLDWTAVSEHYEAALKNPLLLDIERDSWAELRTFHVVMAQTFHPAEEGNLQPIRQRSAEMLEKANQLQASSIPTSFNTPAIREAMAQLTKGAADLHKQVQRKAKDEVLLRALTSLHDTFHIIQGLCSH